MRRLVNAWHRLRMWLRRGELARGLDDEIQFHLEQQTDKNQRAGMTPMEARRAARARFSGVEATKDVIREEFFPAALGNALGDCRHAARALRRAPGFAAAAILTLGLGIGATTAMFSVANGVLLHPLPYAHADRLIEIVHAAPSIGANQLYASPAIYLAYRDHNRTFDAIGLWNWSRSPVTVSGAGDSEAVASAEVTREVLAILGVQPIAGRLFANADDVPGAAPTAILSYDYAQRRFAGGDAVGHRLVVDGVSRDVIGVLPADFRFFAYDVDLFYPLQIDRATATFPSFGGRAIARLKDGVTLASANADVARMLPLLIAEFGGRNSRLANGLEPRLRPLRDSVVGTLDETLWLLLGTIGLLMLIACANVANLVLVRMQTRQPELALRVALGAGRARVARVVVAESAVVGLAGGALGLAIAYAGLPWLLSLGANVLPEIMAITIDPRALGVCLALSLGTTIAFGCLPLLHAALPTSRIAAVLRTGTRTATEGRQHQRTRHLLLISQVAFAVVLLTGAGLMARTFDTLRHVDPGFRDPATILTFQITVPTTMSAESSADVDRIARLHRIMVDRFSAVPGTMSVAFASFNDGLPLDDDGRTVSLVAEHSLTPQADETSGKEVQFVSPRFFETMHTPLVAGREIAWTDVDQNRPIALVSENLARRWWGSASAALGQRVSARESGPWRDVVGVVKDVHHTGLDRAAPEVVVYPAVPSPTAVFVVHSARVGTPGYLPDLQRALSSVDPSLSLARVRTLADLYRHAFARTTMTLRLLALTGAMALLLVVIGVYGAVSYGISRRRREIGIRLALGARRGEVRRMFVGRALLIVSAGILAGLGGALLLTRWLSSQLFGVSALDPLTHAAVAVFLLLAAATASYLSAATASNLNPIDVLKAE
jgi:predicted permease